MLLIIRGTSPNVNKGLKEVLYISSLHLFMKLISAVLHVHWSVYPSGVSLHVVESTLTKFACSTQSSTYLGILKMYRRW